MADHDIFAILTAYNSPYLNFAIKENAPFYQEPSNITLDELSRETTPLWDEQTQHAWKDDHRLELRFSNSLKNPAKGWSFGSSSSCDIKLDGLPGISRQQFYVVIREDLTPFLVDDSSTNGTSVSYLGIWNAKFRKKSNWALTPPSYVDTTKIEPVIHLPSKGYKLKIEFPNHDSKEPEYQANLERFVDKSKADLPELETLRLLSRSTTASASPSTYDESGLPIYVNLKTIASGPQAAVQQVLDPHSGLIFAAKLFRPPASTRDIKAWREMVLNEVKIMKSNVHPNVMRVVHYSSKPFPTLMMPFYPLGDLAKYKHRASESQNLAAFCQVLEVAKFLHSCKIIHRDIKPQNILVECEEPFSIIVSDFGLSKQMAKDMALTRCGTPLYIAPEIFFSREPYDWHADMWSIAVVFLEIFWSIPTKDDLDDTSEAAMHAWWRLLIATLEDIEDDKVADLLWSILDLNAVDRHSADKLLRQGVWKGLWFLDKKSQRYILKEEHSRENTPRQS